MRYDILPLGNRIVVRRLEVDNVTPMGIVKSVTKNESIPEGQVIAIGSGKLSQLGILQKIPLEIGDIVMFGRHAGFEKKDGNENYLVLDFDEVYAILRELPSSQELAHSAG